MPSCRRRRLQNWAKGSPRSQASTGSNNHFHIGSDCDGPLFSTRGLGYIVRRQHDGDRKRVYIHLTPKGRLLEKRLVPLAEEVNRIAVDGVAPEHVAITRAVLLAMIENLARDQIASERSMPSTREIAKLARKRAQK